MTWEETIQMIRAKDDYKDLVRLAYFEEDLPLNVERFKESDEFQETLRLLNTYSPSAKSILDIGSGNGISAINFALKGFQVTAVEPDPSETIGAGAIKKLKQHFKLDSLHVFESLAEDIQFPENSFDVVYIRQAMHHANDLYKFLIEAVRVLKPKGLLLTVRDHVIYDEEDKSWFLKEHPLHKYYGGENAYTAIAYKDAIRSAGAQIKKEIKFYDSVINYFPLTKDEVEKIKKNYLSKYKKSLKKKIGLLAEIPSTFKLYKKIKGVNEMNALDETKVAGRMYSYIAIKK